MHTNKFNFKVIKNPWKPRENYSDGGSGQNRTADTRIFSPLLYRLSYETKMAVPTGIEPAIFCVTGRRDNRYTTEPWLRELDLNQRPSGYEPDELPNCSIPRYKSGGGTGIRTQAPLARPAGFQDRSLQPLGYSSKKWCLRPDLNRHGIWLPQDFKSCASTYFATQALKT